MFWIKCISYVIGILDERGHCRLFWRCASFPHNINALSKSLHCEVLENVEYLCAIHFGNCPSQVIATNINDLLQYWNQNCQEYPWKMIWYYAEVYVAFFVGWTKRKRDTHYSYSAYSPSIDNCNIAKLRTFFNVQQIRQLQLEQGIIALA